MFQEIGGRENLDRAMNLFESKIIKDQDGVEVRRETKDV